MLNKTILDLESTIVKLDEDMSSSRKSIESSKDRQNELEESLKKTLEEKKEFETRLREMELALDDFVQSTESRKKASAQSSEDGSVSCEISFLMLVLMFLFLFYIAIMRVC